MVEPNLSGGARAPVRVRGRARRQVLRIAILRLWFRGAVDLDADADAVRSLALWPLREGSPIVEKRGRPNREAAQVLSPLLCARRAVGVQDDALAVASDGDPCGVDVEWDAFDDQVLSMVLLDDEVGAASGVLFSQYEFHDVLPWGMVGADPSAAVVFGQWHCFAPSRSNDRQLRRPPVGADGAANGARG